MKKIWGLDWLGFSFDDPDVYTFIFNKIEAFSHSERSRFYLKVLRAPGVTLSSIQRNKNMRSYMCEISGEGKYYFDLDALLQRIYKSSSIFRIDVFFDFLGKQGENIIIFPSTALIPLRGQSVCSFRVDGQYSGFVSGKSEFRVRYYNKKLESKNIPVGYDDWWRFEIAVRGDLCKTQNWENPYTTVLSLLKRRFEFSFFDIFPVEVGSSRPAPRARTIPLDLRIHRLQEKLRKLVWELKKYSVEPGFVGSNIIFRRFDGGNKN